MGGGGGGGGDEAQGVRPELLSVTMNTLFIVIHIIGFCEWVDERQESGHMTVSPAKKN